jgi:membrane protein DedA with SNARE-associated domain
MRKLQKYEDKGLLSTVKETLIRHPVRTLVFAKSVAFIAVPTLLLIGRYKAMKIGKYTLWVSIVCLVKDFTVLFLGYGLGISLEAFLDGYDIYRIIAIILAILAVIYIVYKANEEKIEDFTIKTLQNIK